MSITSNNVVANELCEFFEVVIHSILYSRKLYPESIFGPISRYGINVYRCTDTEINEYINESLKAVDYHIRKGHLQKLFICFHTDKLLYERYVFEFVDLKCFIDKNPYGTNLGKYFGEFVMMLHTSNFRLLPLPDEAHFSLRIMTAPSHFTEEPSFENFPWIEISNDENCIKTSNVIPVYNIKRDYLDLSIYVEKSADVYN